MHAVNLKRSAEHSPSLAVTSMMNLVTNLSHLKLMFNAQEVHFLTLFNAQGEKLYFLDCYYLKGSVRMSCTVKHK